MNFTWIAVCILAGAGLCLIMQVIRPKQIPLWVAIGPYVGNATELSTRWQRLSRGLMNFVLTYQSKTLWGSDELVQSWLNSVHHASTVPLFRQLQVRYSAIGGAIVLGWCALRAGVHKPLSIGLTIVLAFGAVLMGGWFAKWQLEQQVRNRATLIQQQLPSVLDLLAFSVAAGEPILAAFSRITRTCSGPLVQEFARVVQAVATGQTVSAALEDAATRVACEPFTRTIRSLTLAFERGTPLAGVLRSQAQDARAVQARALMELASKKETTMMLPVVFFILPMIVVVALYPGLRELQLM